MRPPVLLCLFGSVNLAATRVVARLLPPNARRAAAGMPAAREEWSGAGSGCSDAGGTTPQAECAMPSAYRGRTSDRPRAPCACPAPRPSPPRQARAGLRRRDGLRSRQRCSRPGGSRRADRFAPAHRSAATTIAWPAPRYGGILRSTVWSGPYPLALARLGPELAGCTALAGGIVLLTVAERVGQFRVGPADWSTPRVVDVLAGIAVAVERDLGSRAERRQSCSSSANLPGTVE